MTQATLSRALRVPRRDAVTWDRSRKVILGIVGLLALALVTEIVALFGPERWGVPRVGDLLAGSYALVVGESFGGAIGETVFAVVAATGIALVGGLVFGILIGSSRTIAITLGAPFEIVRPIPALALIPVAILMLGQGAPMEIAVAAFASWWPILFNTSYGVRGVDSVALDAAKAMGDGPFRRVLRVVVPSLMPFVITGVRAALPLTLIVVIAAEYLSTAQRGLGGVLISATSLGRMDVLWCAALVSGLLGIVLGLIVDVIARLTVPWAERRAK